MGGSKIVMDAEVYSDDQSTVFDADDPAESTNLTEVGESVLIEYTVVGTHNYDCMQLLAAYSYLPKISRRLGSKKMSHYLQVHTLQCVSCKFNIWW